MTPDIGVILAQDGLTLGSLYTVLSIGFVLIFTVTRVIFAAYGDLITYAAMTLHALQSGKTPVTAYLSIFLLIAVFVLNLKGRSYKPQAMLGQLSVKVVLPSIPCVLAIAFKFDETSAFLQSLLTIAVMLPIGYGIYEIVFKKISQAPTLVLLIVSLALHYVLAGVALVFFGAEGIRNKIDTIADFSVMGVDISGYMTTVMLAAILASGVLFALFRFTMLGKSLKATAYNPTGAKIVGINIDRSANFAFLLATFIAGVVGILISSNVTIYYDSGMMIGLKGFVGAVFGGFVSYPLAACGAYLIGLVEAYVSFDYSEYKDVIVFLLVIPIVMLRAVFTKVHFDDEAEEEIA